MMNELRSRAKFILWFVIGAFILSMIAVGGIMMFEDTRENPDVLAKIGKDSVTYTELGEIWRNRLQQMYDRGIKVSEEREKEMKKELLSSLIEQKLKLDYAHKTGIRAHDDEVAEYISTIPAFQGVDGSFDKRQYMNFLYGQRIRPDDFENQQKQMLVLAKLSNRIWAGIKFTEDELKEYFVKRSRGLTADYVYFNYKDFLSAIKISEDKMKDYYAVNRQNYVKPERVKASHILIQADASPTSPTGLTDEAALKLAEEILGKIKGGADFAELARKHSADPGSGENGGDLGWFEKGMMVPEFEKAAFELKKGGLSPLVKTQFGYHIIKNTGKEDGFEPTYEKVRSQVLEELRKNEGKELMRKKAEKMRETVTSSGDFASAAKESNIPVKKLPLFRENDKLSAIESESFMDIVFDLNAGDVSGIIEGENGFYIAKITGGSKSRFDDKKFAERRSELAEKLKNIKYDDVYKGLLEGLRAQADIEMFEENL